MRKLVSIAMFLAWLLYGAMPAIGMPEISMSEPALPSAPPAMEHAGHSGTAGKKSHQAAAAAMDHGRVHQETPQPCPHGGKVCSAPFCAGCLTTLPFPQPGQTGPIFHEAPAPQVDLALASPQPAPPTPPPRA